MTKYRHSLPLPTLVRSAGALEEMLLNAYYYIEMGNIEEACGQLRQVYRRCDGESPPPDFVQGPAAEDLMEMILHLMEDLGCELP